MPETKFWVKIDDADLLARLTAHVAASKPYCVSAYELPNGLLLSYDLDTQRWYFYADTECLIVPRRFRESGLVVSSMTYFKNNLVYDAISPWQGIYRPEGQFPNCIAVVQAYANKGGGSAVALTITATPEYMEAFYSAILCRDIRPTTWWQPVPAEIAEEATAAKQ